MDSKQYTDMLTDHFLEDFFRIAGNRANETYFFFTPFFPERDVLLDIQH